MQKKLFLEFKEVLSSDSLDSSPVAVESSKSSKRMMGDEIYQSSESE